METKVLQSGYEPERSIDLGRLGHSLRPRPGCAAPGSARWSRLVSGVL